MLEIIQHTAGHSQVCCSLVPARHYGKCILLSFSRCLCFRVFTVTFLAAIWLHFCFICLIIFLPNHEKMKLKMSQMWPEIGYREQPY